MVSLFHLTSSQLHCRSCIHIRVQFGQRMSHSKSPPSCRVDEDNNCGLVLDKNEHKTSSFVNSLLLHLNVGGETPTTASGPISSQVVVLSVNAYLISNLQSRLMDP